MRRVTAVIAVLIGVVAASNEAAADWTGLSTPVFTTDGVAKGLPHPVTMAVAQDSLGFVWVGTQGGLARFDGYRFISFLHKDGDSASLPTNFIGELAAGDQGRLWIADYGGNIVRYDPDNDGFTAYPEPPGTPPRGFIQSLTADGAGGLWVGTAAGLEHIDGRNGEITRIRRLADADAGTSPDHIRAVVVGGDGTVWVATDQGLWRRPSDGDFARVPLPVSSRGDFPVIAMTEDGNGRLWFCTAGGAIGNIDAEHRVGMVATLPNNVSRRLLTLSMVEASPGQMWIGQFGNGIFVLDMVGGSVRKIEHDPGVPVSLPVNAGRRLIRDRSGQIWVTSAVGISHISATGSAVETVLPSSRTGAIADQDIQGIAAASGKVWLGLTNTGVVRLDPTLSRFEPPLPVDGLPITYVPGFAQGDDGTLWVGTLGTPGLYRYDAASGRLRHSSWAPAPDMTYRRLLAQAGALWMAAGPLLRFDAGTGQLTGIYRHSDAADSLGADTAVLLAPAPEHRLWVGSGAGVDLFDPEHATFRHLRHDPQDPASLREGLVAALLSDRRGRLWVGMLGNGLSVGGVDADGRMRFRHLSTETGLPSNNVVSLLDDISGRIWAGTANGLAVIDPDSLIVRALTRGDGLAMASFNVGSAAKLPDGTLLFGGHGLTVVHPERLQHSHYEAPLALTAIRVDGKARTTSSANRGATLTMAPSERKFEVEFSALDFADPETLHYSYRLDGFEREWVEVDADHRLASYTNLPPGTYRLLIRSRNAAGDGGMTRTLTVAVSPAWWQSWWFTLALGAGGLGLVALLVRVRTTVIRKHAARLEALVARQTRDLTESNARLADLAAHDPLTNLLNRRAFFERGEAELARASRYGRPLSVLMIDIDHFKLVNDRHGHAAGDSVLCALSRHIVALLRLSDLCARLGGEELAVLMPETALDAAHAVGERLRLAVAEEEHEAEAVRFRVTISIGLALRDGDEPLPMMMERADRALYQAKSGGRNRVVSAAPPTPVTP